MVDLQRASPLPRQRLCVAAAPGAACLALLALTSRLAVAAEWTYVAPALGTSAAGTNVKGTTEIDVNSVTQLGPVVKAWFRLSFKKDVTNPVDAAKPVRRMKFLYDHRCDEHQRALVQVVYEDAAGATVYSSAYPETAAKFENVIPDTTGEAWLAAACKIASMKHKSLAKP